MSDLIAANVAAEILGVDRSTVWRLARIGDLNAEQVEGAKGNVYDRAEVEALRDSRAARTKRIRALRKHGVKGIDRIAS
jgi:hypothetical protein